MRIAGSAFAFAPLSSGIPTEEISSMLFGKKEGVITEVVKASEPHKKLVDQVISKITPNFPSPSEWFGIKDKVKEIAEQMHQQALLTPDLKDDKVDYLVYMRDYVDNAPLTSIMPNWFKDFVIYLTMSFNQVTHSSIEYVFTHIYKFVTEIVLYAPEWILGDAWFPAAVSNYSMLSIGLVIVLTMIEGIKRMLKLSHTKFRDTLRKLPLALTVSAATPFLFSTGLKLLNKLTKLIVELSSSSMTSQNASIFATSVSFEPVNVLMMIAFLVIVVFQCVPMILLHGRRWFITIVLGMLTPLAMCASLFDATQGYYQMWLRSLKNISLAQLSYAVFISVLGLIMFGTPNPTTTGGVFSKIILMTGGIHTMAHPPQFIRRFDENGGGFIKMGKEMKNYSTDKYEKYKKYKETTEDVLVKGSSFAGKGFRFFFNKKK